MALRNMCALTLESTRKTSLYKVIAK
jgi:hypothetical protein